MIRLQGLPMHRTSVTARVLASSPAKNAVLRGDVGTLIRLVREAHGWRQRDLGSRTGFSQAAISRIENGRGSISDVRVLGRLADVLGVPRQVLGLAPQDVANPLMPLRRTVEDVKRSDFVRGMLGAAAVLALPQVVTEDTPGAVDGAVVRECRAALQRLYELDDQLGGVDVYALTVQMVKRLRNTLARASYRTDIGQELRVVTAATAEHAAWLAFDAGSNERARGWWLEALLMAEMCHARDVRVVALASMALQAASSDHAADGREAVDLIQAAHSAAGTDGTPRLYSLLAAREALGHARAGDAAAAARALFAAERLLDRERSDDDPPWLSFWGEADLASHEARAAVYLGDLVSAERAARRMMSHADKATHPRNFVLYSARLGIVLARAGKLEESIAVTTPLVGRVNSFGSNRLRGRLRDAVQVLEQHQDYRPVRQFTTWTRKVLDAA